MNYLISSSSFYLLKEEIDKIIKNSTNVSKFDLNFVDINDILEEAAYFSLFDEQKYIIITNADFFTTTKTKMNEEPILNYLENPNPNTTLIFTTFNRLDSRKKITTFFKKTNEIIEIKSLSAKEIYTKLENKLKKEKYNISTDSLYYIINNSQNNYDLAYNTIEKIKLYCMNTKDIKQQDVIMLVPNNIEDNSFKFIDTVINKEYKKAISILNDLKLNKVEIFSLINLLFREYKLLLQTKILSKQKKSKNEILTKLKIQDWMLDKYIKNSYLYDELEIENIIHKLLELDYKIKTGKINKDLGLELLILGI